MLDKNSEFNTPRLEQKYMTTNEVQDNASDKIDGNLLEEMMGESDNLLGGDEGFVMDQIIKLDKHLPLGLESAQSSHRDEKIFEQKKELLTSQLYDLERESQKWQDKYKD